MREYIFYVYILQSASRRALYIGMTNNLSHARGEAQSPKHTSRGATFSNSDAATMCVCSKYDI